MKTLLVPTDFSQEATQALEVATAIARKTGAHIQLLHVVETIPQPAFAIAGEYIPDDPMERVYVLKLFERAQQQLTEIQETQLKDIPVKCVVKTGEVYPTIARYLEEEKVDLIVMGTKGAGWLDQIMVGSNTEKVVRHAKCLVLTVQSAVPRFTINNLLLPTDFETISEPFFKTLAELQEHYHFGVHLLYVNTPLSFRTTTQIELKKAKFLKKIPLTNVTYSIVDDYLQESGIHSFARKHSFDMIAMLTHQRKGLTHFLEGSITEEVLHQSPIPILTYGL